MNINGQEVNFQCRVEASDLIIGSTLIEPIEVSVEDDGSLTITFDAWPNKNDR